MIKRRRACIGRTTNLFSRCKRNNVSTFHQYACLNIARHACNKRDSSLVEALHKKKMRSNLLRCTLFRGREREGKRLREMFSLSPLQHLIFFTQFPPALNSKWLLKKSNKCTNKCATRHAGLHFFLSLKCEDYLSLITTET